MTLPIRTTTHKVLLAVYATLLVLCVAVIVVFHRMEQQARFKEAQVVLNSVTSALAEQLNADHVDLLLEKYDGRGTIIRSTQDAWYYVMHDHLRRASKGQGLTLPVQVLVYDEQKQELQVVVTSDQQPSYRMPFQGTAGPILERYAEGGIVELIQPEGTVLTHVAPLRSPDGRQTAVVVACLSNATIEAGSMDSLWRNILIAVVLFGAAGVVLFRSVGRWLRSDERERERLYAEHTGITDSIAYAGKIQRALVPSSTVYTALYRDAFIIDRPKHVVSGDFHWCHRISEDVSLVATADCTGHGLPGAMLAAIGCSLLNEIAIHHADKDPAEILGILNTRLTTTLHQQGVKRGAGDGMDIALCRIDRQEREILFAGAMRPLYWLHRGQLTVINGDRRPIGGSQHELDRRFTCHRLAFAEGDRIYLFSDGYVDQFGGPERKRFMAARLHTLLSAHPHLSMPEQAELLEHAFLEWKGGEEQVDDVCMIGLAV